MRRVTLLLAALFVLPVFAADEKPWPQKGDAIFVSAKLRWSITLLLPGGPVVKQGAVEPCAMITVNRRVTGDHIYFRDETGEGGRLEGEWRSHLHKTETECLASVKDNGLPHVQATAASFRILDPSHENSEAH